MNPNKSTTGTALAKILQARFDRAQQMGCNAVEPDNMDVYDETAHDPSGFPLTYEDQMFFNLWVSEEVRARGMAVGLKNNINQAQDPRTIEAFDFVVSEQCVQYDECGVFSEFINAGKPVFLAEYELEPEIFCPVAKAYRISATGKREQLDTYRENCDSYYGESIDSAPSPVESDNSANSVVVGVTADSYEWQPLNVCDYTNANDFEGWGWNAFLGRSCEPLTGDTDVTPSIDDNCNYSFASLHDGWGWNNETQESCAPISTSVSAPSKHCDYSNAGQHGGWGWDPVSHQSCEPLSTDTQCVDSVGDGWGWDGFKSCIPST